MLSSQYANRFLQTVDIAEIFARLLDTLSEGLLTLTHPNTRVVELFQWRQCVNLTSAMVQRSHLLVGLVGTIGITYLCLEVVLLFGYEVLENRIGLYSANKVKAKKKYPDANEISKLGVGVDVHLDDTVANSSGDLFCRGSRSAVEDEVATNPNQRRSPKYQK